MHLHPLLVIQALDVAIQEQAIAHFKAQGGQIATPFHGDTYIVSDLALFARSHQEATDAVMANYSPKEKLCL